MSTSLNKILFSRLWLLLTLSMSLGEAAAQSPRASDCVERLKAADRLWLKGSYAQAVVAYRVLLDGEDLLPVFRPLVLLRLARIELVRGDREAAGKILDRLQGTKGLPRHHQMAASELRLGLTETRATASARTVVPTWPKSAAVIHVQDGAVMGDGSQGHPWATIKQALAQARSLRKGGKLELGPVEIRLVGKALRIHESLRLTTEDSGTAKNPLLLRGVGPDRIRLSGSVTLRHWDKITDPAILARLPVKARGRALVAAFGKNGVPLLEALELGGFSSLRARGSNHRFRSLAVPELFYKGDVQRMARWPNEGDVRSPLTGFTTDRPLRWLDETELWLHGYWHHSWADAYEKVKRIDAGKRVVHLVPPTNRYGFRRCQWHAVNALAEMDQQGEWHLDSAGRKIRYYPPADFDPESCQLSCRGPILEATHCQHLMIQHVDLGYARSDCMIFDDCSDLILADCSVSRSSGCGIVIRGGQRHLILGCKIQSMGRGGIDLHAGDRLELESSDSIVENCVISDLSRIDRTYTPALLLEGMGMKIRHCRFDLIPSSAIRLEGNDTLIELNEFKRCVWESDDQGAIDMWGNPTYRGNVIRWNYFHDNVKPDAHYVAGVRLDDAICGTAITENVFVRTANGRFGGTQIHGGQDNHVEGNLFLDCEIAMSQTPWGAKRWKKMLATHAAIARSLAVTPWQSPEWLARYPRLATLMEEPRDRNYFADNIAIRSRSLFARKSATSPSFNDRLVRGDASGDRHALIQAHLVPWHPIPWKAIGPYSGK